MSTPIVEKLGHETMFPGLYYHANRIAGTTQAADPVVAVLQRHEVQYALLRCFLCEPFPVSARNQLGKDVQDVLRRTSRSLPTNQSILLHCTPAPGDIPLPHWDMDFIKVRPIYSGASIELPVVTGSFVFHVTYCKDAVYLVALDSASVRLENGTYVNVQLNGTFTFLFDAQTLNVVKE